MITMQQLMINMQQLAFDSILKETSPQKETKIEQLTLEIEEEPKIWWNSSTSNISPSSLFAWTPANNITFKNENKECGRLTWDGGVFKFDGNAETSAKLFFNYVGKFCGMKVQS